MESLTSDMSQYNVISQNSSDFTKMFYVAKISKFPNCTIFKSLTMKMGHGTIGREAAFRKSDSHLENPL